MQKFGKASTCLRETDVVDFLLYSGEKGVCPGFVPFDDGKADLGTLPDIVMARFGAGNRKTNPAASEDLFDHAALFLETVYTVKIEFQSQNADHHFRIRYTMMALQKLTNCCVAAIALVTAA
jgi:hypothetical protein